MPQLQFGSATNPQKILDAGPDGAWIILQVLDTSTLFFDKSREILQGDGYGAATPDSKQGFQLKQSAVFQFYTLPWKGELWGMSDTKGAIIAWQIAAPLHKGSCGCGGKAQDKPQPGFDEEI